MTIEESLNTGDLTDEELEEMIHEQDVSDSESDREEEEKSKMLDAFFEEEARRYEER